MSSSTTLAFTLFFGSAIAGYYFLDVVRRWKNMDTRIEDLEHTVHDVTSMQEAQADTIQENDQRIREKKDYDSSEELQEGKYQAWKGLYHDMYRKIEITIWREKYSTIQKNEDWVSWDQQVNPSTVVRDFYLGNSNPDFSWDIVETEHLLSGSVSETLVNGWDSIIKIQITTSLPSKESLLEFTNQEYYNGSPTWNLALKKAVDEKLIQWSRSLIDA